MVSENQTSITVVLQQVELGEPDMDIRLHVCNASLAFYHFVRSASFLCSSCSEHKIMLKTRHECGKYMWCSDLSNVVL